MTLNGWIQILIFCGIVILLVKPLGGYMTRVYTGERTFLGFLLAPFERLLYRVAGTNEREEQHWTTYVGAMLAFNLLGFLVLYLLQRFQAALPLQSRRHGGCSAGTVFQHRGQLRHQHQLAELRRRKHDVLSRADGRPDRSELRFRGHRHGAGRLH